MTPYHFSVSSKYPDATDMHHSSKIQIVELQKVRRRYHLPLTALQCLSLFGRCVLETPVAKLSCLPKKERDFLVPRSVDEHGLEHMSRAWSGIMLNASRELRASPFSILPPGT